MKRQLSNGLTLDWEASPEKPIAISSENLSDVDEAAISVIQIENESTPEPKRYKHSSKNLFEDIDHELEKLDNSRATLQKRLDGQKSTVGHSSLKIPPNACSRIKSIISQSEVGDLFNLKDS